MAQIIKAASQYQHMSSNFKIDFQQICKSILIHAIIYLFPVKFLFTEHLPHWLCTNQCTHLIERRSIFFLNQVMVSELHAKPLANSDRVNE